MRAVCERFGLPFDEPPEVKTADSRVLMAEKRDLMRAGRALPKWSETEPPIDRRIVGVSWRSAEISFLRRFEELTQLLEARLLPNTKPSELNNEAEGR